MDTKELVKELKNRLKISDVAERLGCEVFPGGKLRCLRPENHSHGDRTPSASIDDNYGSFKCWVCDDVKGDIINLVRLKNNCGFGQALDYLAEMAGIENKTNYNNLNNNYGSGFSNSRQINNSNIQNHSNSSPLIISPKSINPISKPNVVDAKAYQEKRIAMIKAFLKLLKPPGGAVYQYLKRRNISFNVQRRQYLLMIHDYGFVNESLKAQFSLDDLKTMGFFSEKGNLRFYKHLLIFPYFDKDQVPVYFQARAIEPDVVPKELSFKGHIPCPYNMRVLNKKPGVVYLCEGVIDTLTLTQFNNDAVGIPGVNNFKPEWVSLFENKRVFIVFDQDNAGRQGADKVMELLKSGNIEVHKSKVLGEGMDINDFFSQNRFKR